MNKKSIQGFFLGLACCLFSLTVFTNSSAHVDTTIERPIVLVITSYKNSEWAVRNLESVFSQDYSNWRIIYVDDRSPDGTGDIAERYILEKGMTDKVTLIKNKERMLKVANFYHAVVKHCQDHEIVIDLDGDDWLAHENVLSTVNEAYTDPDVWMTYGSYEAWPKHFGCCCKPIPDDVVQKNDYRVWQWTTSHLKSFYAWLFKRIKREDLMYEGEFFDMTGDLAMMFPMIEMTGGKFKFIPEVLYIYNRENPINDDKKDGSRQWFLDKQIRLKAKYSQVETSPLDG